MTRPARSFSAPSQLRRRRSRDAGRPDDGRGRQPVVADGHAVGVALRDRRAEADLDAQPFERAGARPRSASRGKAGSTRGPASTSTMRASRGSMLRKSWRSATRASSAMAPAISTPVGPPPITTKVRRRRRASGRVAASACSKAIRMRRRMSVASSIVLQAGRHALPFVVAEIGVPRAGREHQVVVGDRRGPRASRCGAPCRRR